MVSAAARQPARSLSDAAQRLLTSRKALAQEFSDADRSPEFRSNGTAMPNDPDIPGALRPRTSSITGSRSAAWWSKPASLSLAELRALPSRTQTTRHDCVEGWSAIGKWKGAKLSRAAGDGRSRARRRAT